MAYKKFCTERNHNDGYPVLLVDSEDPVTRPGHCWAHLAARTADLWDRPDGVENDQCQLMVQAIEAWLFADPEALAEFYGQGFRRGALRNTADVEEILKSDHLPSLNAATDNTQKGRYHMIRRLAPLLLRLSPVKIRKRAPHLDRIFVDLLARLKD